MIRRFDISDELSGPDIGGSHGPYKQVPMECTVCGGSPDKSLV